MSDAQRLEAQRFDAYYAHSRDRMLALAFAMTGDLAASRGAVRDSLVATWHHWRKVRRLEDPDLWVRPLVWSHAQRRHTARIWHRDRKLDPEVRATLDALAKVPVVARKALLLTQLTSASRHDMAREVGLPLEEAENRLQLATSQFALHRQVASTSVRPLLDQLAEYCRDQRWPRATIIRRAGTSRRRAHALAGAVLVVVALMGSGLLVADDHGVHPTLAAAGERLSSVPADGTGEESNSPSVPITPSSLVSKAQLDRAMPGHVWRITGTDPKQGTTFPCQRRSYADPRTSASLVRSFTARRAPDQPQVAVVQAMEASETANAARSGFLAANRWFAACTVPQMQLVTLRRVTGLGDDARQYVLRSWRRPAATFVLGVARTGRINTLTLTRTSGRPAPDLAGNLRVLVSAVDDLCSTPLGGRCSALPEALAMPAPAAGRPPMMLAELDLPPASGLDQPWVGTTPARAVQNVAATGCDRSSFSGRFHGHLWQHARTRSFLVPDAHLAPTFGITETVGRLPEPDAAAFVAGVRAKLATCPHRDLGTDVQRLASGLTWTAWRVRTEVSKQQTLTMFMGVVRSRGAVAQVGFVADGSHTMSGSDFEALVRRAGERLAALPS
jgi:DNA-directed RNA polymerase specialized sigma24 family protein